MLRRLVRYAPSRSPLRESDGVSLFMRIFTLDVELFVPLGIQRRHGDVLGKTTGNAGESVLAIALALMRIARVAVFADWSNPLADTRAPLIDDHALPFAEPAYCRPELVQHACDLANPRSSTRRRGSGTSVLWSP